MNEQDTNVDIQQLLECPVCMESFGETKHLPIAIDCQHTLCSACIEKLEDNQRITCPTCSCKSQLKSKDILKLPKDIARLNLIDIMKKRQKQKRPVTLCTSCDEGDKAVNYCGECNEYLCEDCTASHKRLKKTKGHELVSAWNEDNGIEITNVRPQDSSTCISMILCEKHTSHPQQTFCCLCEVLVCDICAKEDHDKHRTEPCGNIYSSKSEELCEILNKLKEKCTESHEIKIEKATRTVCDLKSNLTRDINQQHEKYSEILSEKKHGLFSIIEKWCHDHTEELNNAKHQMDGLKDLIKTTEATIRDLDRVAFLKGYLSLKRRLQEGLDGDIAVPSVTPLNFTQVCPTDDFAKIVSALGTVQEGPTPNTDETGMDEDRPGSIRYDTTCSPLMEVLKSLSLHSGSFVASLNAGETVPVEELYNRRSLPDTASMSHTEYVSMRVPGGGRRKLYDLPHVRQLTMRRFQTWDLTGMWEVKNDDVVMYSNSTEEAEQCLQLLNESLVEKRVAVGEDTMVLLESDKWQILNRELERKYPEQVSTCVDHNSNEVVCTASSTAVLEDVADKVRLFLRDNQVKQMILTYSKETVKKIMKYNTSLAELKASYSQYCLQIIHTSESSICLKGIGIGFGEAVRRVHELARKCATDEDRFDSDIDDDDDEDSDDDGNEDTRFEESGNSEGKGSQHIDVQMVMGETPVNAICLPGDSMVLYVVREDITKLNVEGLVNPADPRLKHDGGLAKILVKQGGRSIQDECKIRVMQKGTLEIGDVYSSSAGSLRANVIIHAVGPKWKDGNSGEMEALKKAVHNSLQTAAQQRLSSLAIPAIGAGSYGMPVDRATNVIVKTVGEFLKNKTHCSIREVYFCDVTASTVEHFARALLESFDRSDVILSLVKMDTLQPVSQNDRQNSQTSEHDVRTPVGILMM